MCFLIVFMFYVSIIYLVYSFRGVEIHHSRRVWQQVADMAAGAGGSWSCGSYRQEAESGRRWCSARLLLMLLRTLVDGVVPPTFGVALPTSVNQV